jgi:hypothetical protein
MKEILPKTIIGAMLLLLAGCASVPPEVAKSSETLGRYAAKLGDAGTGIVDEYDNRLTRVSTTMARTSETYIRAYKSDVDRLGRQIVELEQGFDKLAGGIDLVLKADPQTPRSALLTEVQGEKLKEVADTLRKGSQARKKEREDITNPEGFEKALKLLAETQDKQATQQKQVRDALKARLASEYAELAQGFADLTAYLRSLVRLTEERKRVLGGLESSAGRMSER